MKTYILFLFGLFEDRQDIEYFCSDVLGECPSVHSLKYVIDNTKNIIVIFDSDDEETSIRGNLDDILKNEAILFYFLFRKDDIVMSDIPETMKGLIFKPDVKNSVLKIEISSLSIDVINDKNIILDTILDKIDKFGVDSLTDDEKKFLDDFEK